MKAKNKAAFRGPHKINFKTKPTGFAFYKMTAPSKYSSFEYTPIYRNGDLVVRHYSFFERLWLFIKSVFHE